MDWLTFVAVKSPVEEMIIVENIFEFGLFLTQSYHMTSEDLKYSIMDHYVLCMDHFYGIFASFLKLESL